MESFQRYKLTLAYRGTAYHGWQHQWANSLYKGPPPPLGQGIPTIQEVLSRTIASVVGHPVTVVGSSRTDAGVHAKGQLAHFDLQAMQIDPHGLRRAIDERLPEDIFVHAAEPVDENWDAITCTISKRYQYLVWNAPDRNPFMADLAFYRWQKLNVPAMVEAAKHLVGQHDFASFCRPGHHRENTIRTVLGCDVAYRAPRLVIGVEGTGFLWNMVRIIAGTLVEVGLGRYRPDDVAQMLSEKDRRAAGSTAPAHGLYLQWIKCSEATRPPAPAPPPRQEMITIRETRPTDASAVLAIAASLPACFSEPDRQKLASDFKFQCGFKALAGRDVRGFVLYYTHQAVGYIDWIGVAPAAQRQGIGRALLQRVIGELRKGKVKVLRVGAAADEAFWSKMRFEREDGHWSLATGRQNP